MNVRFEDHLAFQRAALWSAAGGAVLGAFGPLPLAVAGSALGLSIACANAGWRNRLLAAGGCAAAAVVWAVAAHPWSAWACGATLALLFAAVRAGSANAAGTRPPSPIAVALTVAGGAAAVALGSELLPASLAALSTVAPGWIAAALSGAVLGLWAAVCSAPLHVAVDREPLGRIGDDLQRQSFADLRAAEELSREIERYLRLRA
jgi:hypothetical protein